MIERLHAHLASCPANAGTPAEELLGLIFADRGSDEGFGHWFLTGLLAGDPRFEQDPADGSWRLATDHVLDRALEQAPFVVVDIEATGQRAELLGITEIGALRMEGSREVDRFLSLVNPGRPIPPYVVKLTGITDEMVAAAPPIEEVMPRFATFLAGAVLVAHDTAFDVAVLDRASRRVLGRPLGAPTLCTLKLVRRLFPELEKASLDALAKHLGLVVPDRHRAIGDAELTTAVLAMTLEAAGKRGCRTVGELLALQRGEESRRPQRIGVGRRTLERLPERAGVYWLLGAEGRTLYVAEADNLREHVVAQITGATNLGGRRSAMVHEIVDVGFEPTCSQLDAAIVLAQESAARQPVYNRRDRHLPRGSFVKVARRGRFPRVMAANRIAADGAVYLGPVKDGALARTAAELFARLYGLRTCSGRLAPHPEVEPCERGPAGWCSSPCNALVDQRGYGLRVEALIRDLAAGGRPVRDRLSSSDAAGASRQDHACLGRLMKLHRDRHWLVDRHDYLIAVPTAGGRLRLLLVVGGVCRFASVVLRRDQLAAALSQARQAISSESRATSPEHADLSTVLAHWVRRRDAESDRVLAELSRHDLDGSIAAAGADLETLVSAEPVV